MSDDRGCDCWGSGVPHTAGLVDDCEKPYPGDRIALAEAVGPYLRDGVDPLHVADDLLLWTVPGLRGDGPDLREQFRRTQGVEPPRMTAAPTGPDPRTDAAVGK